MVDEQTSRASGPPSRSYFEVPFEGSLAPGNCPSRNAADRVVPQCEAQLRRAGIPARGRRAAGHGRRRRDGALAPVSWAELEAPRGRARADAAQRRCCRGDRVAAYPAQPRDAVVAFLATASLGAVWSLCSTGHGGRAWSTAFEQIAPKVLIATDGYRFGGRLFDRREIVAALRAALPSVIFIRVPSALSALASRDPFGIRSNGRRRETRRCASSRCRSTIRCGSSTRPARRACRSRSCTATAASCSSISSCTALHNDLRPEDRFHWYSSTGWIMWNFQWAACSPVPPSALRRQPRTSRPGRVVALRRRSGRHVLRQRRRVHTDCMKAGIAPRANGRSAAPALARLDRLAAVVGRLRVAATRVRSSRVDQPDLRRHRHRERVRRRQLHAPCLRRRDAMPLPRRARRSVERRRPAVIGQVGELVCTAPMPSMPLGFWDDRGDRRYRDSYFDTFPGVWRHGDWIEITPRGGADHLRPLRCDDQSPRHPHGHERALPRRRGAARDRRQPGRRPRVPRTRVVHAALRRAARGRVLDDALRARIEAAIRTALTPKHVPTRSSKCRKCRARCPARSSKCRSSG